MWFRAGVCLGGEPRVGSGAGGTRSSPRARPLVRGQAEGKATARLGQVWEGLQARREVGITLGDLSEAHVVRTRETTPGTRQQSSLQNQGWQEWSSRSEGEPRFGSGQAWQVAGTLCPPPCGPTAGVASRASHLFLLASYNSLSTGAGAAQGARQPRPIE